MTIVLVIVIQLTKPLLMALLGKLILLISIIKKYIKSKSHDKL